jgi:hypothetical protein
VEKIRKTDPFLTHFLIISRPTASISMKSGQGPPAQRPLPPPTKPCPKKMSH